jgi:hypothetical protein
VHPRGLRVATGKRLKPAAYPPDRGDRQHSIPGPSWRQARRAPDPRSCCETLVDDFRLRIGNGSGTAHSASVSPAGPATARVSARSPCRGSSSPLTHLPATSLVTNGRRASGHCRPTD